MLLGRRYNICKSVKPINKHPAQPGVTYKYFSCPIIKNIPHITIDNPTLYILETQSISLCYTKRFWQKNVLRKLQITSSSMQTARGVTAPRQGWPASLLRSKYYSPKRFEFIVAWYEETWHEKLPGERKQHGSNEAGGGFSDHRLRK